MITTGEELDPQEQSVTVIERDLASSARTSRLYAA